MLILFGKI